MQTLKPALLLWLTLGNLGFSQPLDVRSLIWDRESYTEEASIEAPGARVLTHPLNEVGDYAIVELEGKGPAQVTLTIPDATRVALLDLKWLALHNEERIIRGEGNRVVADIDEEGYGWFVLYHAPPPVDVLSYRPKPLLKVPRTEIRKARFPVVDIHTHISFSPLIVDATQRLRVMDEVGVAIAIDSPEAVFGLTTEKSFGRFEGECPSRFMTFASVDLGYSPTPETIDQACRKLAEDFKTYPVCGVGELMDKGTGISRHPALPDPTGAKFVDDALFDPLWETAAKLGLPVLFHTAEPAGWYLPADRFSEHFPMIGKSPWYSLRNTPALSREEMLAKRDRVLERHPNLVFISAHMDNQTEDLGALAERLRKYPNLYMEIGVRHPQLARQPRNAKRFMTEYQDRILYGADSLQTTSGYQLHFRLFETEDDYVIPPFGQDTIYPLYGIGLPEEVLRKFYYGNAARIIPGVREKLENFDPDLVFPD